MVDRGNPWKRAKARTRSAGWESDRLPGRGGSCRVWIRRNFSFTFGETWDIIKRRLVFAQSGREAEWALTALLWFAACKALNFDLPGLKPI